MILSKFSQLKWWQVILIAVGASAIGGLASGVNDKKEKKLYNVKLKQAPWAPPAWLFGPAWTFNNIFLLLGLQSIIRSDTNEKQKLLLMQGAIWAIFFSFGYVYFNKRSTVLAAIWTMGDAALATASIILALKGDKKLSLYYLPLLLWTAFATTLATYQALYNTDPVLGTKALLK
ncbi:tryptophan-rich sensory protein [Mucilaginibacter sp. HMF5004]|uniref:tryptophan-rich sensory protein n=1 Tax=Mucilaginibacter rivuli TaxID=2857527 RepID=UPI001C601D71|nr:TspO/MBR family protein [Mucilaginibacter rivuli]MBW4890687.1 tryptophan-rich sensory protein [Mucilaginibacter rivuli]